MNKEKILSLSSILLVVFWAIVPLFVSFPFRVNIFISWEGAYRMSNGELPFADFGTSLGGMYWVVPALFMKIFGPQFITLVKAQVFLNILAGLSFRSILKSFGLQPQTIFVSVFLFCISYSFFNFWPWYNHSVIVYQLIGLAFFFSALFQERFSVLTLFFACLFSFCSFLTKQDAGGMALALIVFLAFIDGWVTKKWRSFLWVSGFVLVFVLAFIVLVKSSTGLSYWFNHGQAPHTSRISISELVGEFFYGSVWLKFYLFIISLLVFGQFKDQRDFFKKRNEIIFLLFTIAILGEAAIFQVTSYTPPDNNIFFHSFAVAYILHLLSERKVINFSRNLTLFVATAGMLLWWSNTYWKYFQRVIDRALPPQVVQQSQAEENVVNRSTYMLNQDTTEVPMSEWIFSSLPSFKNIYMPRQTVEGIDRLINSEVIQKVKKDTSLKVLNMTELTPLAHDIPFSLEKGNHYPLWFHLGVSMFNKQAEMFEERIANQYYELVLFEYIPNLNNFFPFRVRDSLNLHYQKIDSFMAPRRGDTKGVIEVYSKKIIDVSVPVINQTDSIIGPIGKINPSF